MCARTCYNMDMKMKRTFPLALAAILTAGALSGIQIPLSARAEGVLPLSETAPVIINEDNAELHLPESYEQYLPLVNPTYIAVHGDNIAIADGSSIYIYSETEEGKFAYTRYDHEPLNEPTPVSKIQFSDDGELYFRDAGNQLWHYDIKTQTRDQDPLRDISCQTFLIHGEYLYFVTETPNGPSFFYYVPMNDLQFSSRTTLKTESVASNPRMAYANDTLYCIINNGTVDAFTYNGTTHIPAGGSFLNSEDKVVDGLQFVCAYQNELFYTVKGEGADTDGIWRSALNGKAQLVYAGENFSAISAYGDKLYCVQGSSIREFTIKDSVKPTGYEIASNSSSSHRLSGASETVRTKDLVAVADQGNKRISVYNRLENSYDTIACVDESGVPFTPEHIAIGKEEVELKANGDIVTTNKIAVSNEKHIYEYTYERHSLKANENGAGEPVLHTAPQKIKGMSYVYGECYYITDYNGYGTLGNATTGELHFASELKSPDAIASDVYGTVYVAFGNKIHSFSEEDFLTNGASGNELVTLSDQSDKAYVSLSVDYEGNVWHLNAEGELYCNNEKMASIDGGDFVYLKENIDPEEHNYHYPVSFALSFEDDEIYFNFENYVVKTNAYALEGLPSLNKITAGESKEKAFELADPDNLFVSVPAGSVGFEIALDELKTSESEYFPYESYFRLEGETRRGVLLYEPQGEGYYVVALYNSELRTFTANLFHSSKNQLVEPDEKHYEPDEQQETAYVSSDISLLSAPCLFPAPKNELVSTLADIRIPRGTKIKVLGYAEGEDRVYAYVEVVDNAREVQKGYIPRSYLTKNDPSGVAKDSYVLGYLKGDAGIKLVSEDGTELEITERTQAKLYLNEDGTYTAVVVKDNVVYTGIVGADDIFRGTTDAVRISLIVILSVLALVIVFGYVFLMFPRRKKKK